ncbi:phosphocholine cytidylyltransferase family protein [Candidatus Woesearchaeota archaeon]|nr:phosphocholine cytidylyltransferase family protein [Candidatus Woesearchaeota archaeon]
MKAVILAAGMGTRLFSLMPKPLISLKNEKTILGFQVERLSEIIGLHNIIIVVGYKHHIIMEKFPKLTYIYNHEYTQTNTSKSLLYALNKIQDEDVLWINGDVYFDKEILKLLLNCEDSCCLVDNKKCGEEEIKYNLNEDGYIKELSKKVKEVKGEALGINIIRKKELELFKKELEKVEKKDYFEKALENLALTNKLKLKPVNVDSLFCQEIDFPEDLKKVKEYISKNE